MAFTPSTRLHHPTHWLIPHRFRPIRKNEGFDQIFCVDEDYAPTKTVAAIKGMIPYRPGASVDPAAPAFVPGAPPPANPTWVHSSSRFVPPPAAQAPRWAPPQEDADLARALAASRADMQRPPPVPSVDADLELRRMDTGEEPTCEDGTVDHILCCARRSRPRVRRTASRLTSSI